MSDAPKQILLAQATKLKEGRSTVWWRQGQKNSFLLRSSLFVLLVTELQHWRSSLPTSSESNTTPSSCSTSSDMGSLSPEEALALFVDCKMSRASYERVRATAKQAGHKLYPPYYLITRAKRACCVPEDKMTITEARAELSLQAILDLTAQRLCQVQQPVLKHLMDEGLQHFTLFSKWGCDGSGGQSSYKRKSDLAKRYAWQNRVPGSTRFCRPVKFIFTKETTECIISETDQVKQQIENLSPTTVEVDGRGILVKHHFALTETKSTQACFICKATPKHFEGKLPLPPPIVDRYTIHSFGLSTLHAWIRTFEFLLQLSYKLDIHKKRVTDGADKDAKRLKKAKVQREFKEQLGLNIDKPKQGLGNTNDGNTARRFFENSGVTSSITGIDENILVRFRVNSSRYFFRIRDRCR